MAERDIMCGCFFSETIENFVLCKDCKAPLYHSVKSTTTEVQSKRMCWDECPDSFALILAPRSKWKK